MYKLRLLAIGPKSRVSKNTTGGLSIMFDGFVESAQKKGIEVSVLNMLQRWDSTSNAVRSLDIMLNFFVLIKILGLSVIKFKKINCCYFASSLSERGVFRDLIIVRILKLFRVIIISHQFGATTDHFQPAINRVGEKRFRWLLNSFSHIIVEGDLMKSQFDRFPLVYEKMTVLPNALPQTGEHAMSPKKYLGGEFNLIYLSNLIYTKGWRDVLQAIDILVNDYQLDVKCVFAGKFMLFKDDPQPMVYDKHFFEKYVTEHGLSEHVSYFPGLFGKEKDENWQIADAFLLPSYYINEGQPISILEAMSYGCVPIVTKYRHIPMMVTEDNGCFVEPQSPTQIAKVVKYLIENPSVFNEKSENCVCDFKEKFTFEKYSDAIFRIINDSVID